jgi:hypothetical protein
VAAKGSALCWTGILEHRGTYLTARQKIERFSIWEMNIHLK